MMAESARSTPYRDARRAHPKAPTRRFVHIGGDERALIFASVIAVLFSAFVFVVSSRVVEADCAHLDNELSCEITESTFLSSKQRRARARDVTEARLETVYGGKGSKRSRLWLVSDTGETPMTDWFPGDVAAQARAAREVTSLAASAPPARASFRFGSRFYGVAQGSVGLLVIVVLFAIGWQRVRLSHSPSEGLVEIERWSPLRRATSAIVGLSEIDGVAIAKVRRARGRAGHRLELVLKDLTRVPIATIATSSRATIGKEQRRLASWLGVAAIG